LFLVHFNAFNKISSHSILMHSCSALGVPAKLAVGSSRDVSLESGL